MLPLMQILNRYDHEYHFFVDWKCWPWGDKSSELVNTRIDEAVLYLIDKIWVDVLIVPPFAESRIKKQESRVLGLFEAYMLEHALRYSIVGKLGILLESETQKETTEEVIREYTNIYTPAENQKNIKKFHTDFPIWAKSVRMWNYFLTTYGRRDWMVRKTLKTDLRYFSDADVDTIIPISRWFLFYQKIIRMRINWKKKRFHWLDAVQECFEKIVDNKKASTYSVTLHCTDHPTPLLEEKRWKWVLSRGDLVNITLIDLS